MWGTYTEPRCAGSVRISAALSWRGGLVMGCVAMVMGCAGDLPRGSAIIRSGEADGEASPPLDAGPPALDAGVALADAGRPAERAVWVVVRDAPWASGVRARLQPPHRPDGTIDEAGGLPGEASLIPWRGPGDPATAALAEGLASRARRATAAVYRLGERLDAAGPDVDPVALAVADASWLAARLDPAPGALRVDGRPVVVVAARWSVPAHQAAFEGFRGALDARVGPAWWVAQVRPDAPQPGADAVMPDCAVADPAARNRARRVAQSAGVGWLPCASPGVNPRLEQPGAVVDPPDTDAFRRALILARRAAGLGPVVVDGAGGWGDDRQLDPIVGSPTAAPISLTTGLVYAPYGAERLVAVREVLLRPDGPPPTALGRAPALLELTRSLGVLVERLDYDAQGISLALQDSSGDGRYEVLLDDRPFRVPAGATLRYRRDDPRLALDLVFDDGARLVDLVPDPGDAPAVTRLLHAFAGRRVEEVSLVYSGGAGRLDARLERAVLTVDGP